jgi:uncharacterized protein
VLLNPWARHAYTQARTEVRHYYAARVLDPGFWRRLLSGQVAVVTGLRELAGKLWLMARAEMRNRPDGEAFRDYRDRMTRGAQDCDVPQLYVLSGRDQVCAEFQDFSAGPSEWRGIWKRPAVRRLPMPLADHTFSSADLRGVVEDATLDHLWQLLRRG